MGVRGKGMAFESPWPHISPVESPRGNCRAANSSGDRYPSELCGLSLLYSFLQVSICALDLPPFFLPIVTSGLSPRYRYHSGILLRTSEYFH
jgi:hypothetical protein